ncbi:MAG: helix-turn-helix domain-containing protein [Clostridia bacterium]|nr:helix-turn-helix domain-containing protein [Clostridia bacterium]
MCQIDYTTENKKNKPLDEFELSKIETLLNEGYSATQIAEEIERDASTIQKEIKNFSIITKAQKDCAVCGNYNSCTKTKICGNNMNIGYCSSCKGCKIAVENCNEYDPQVTCERLRGKKRVCNDCMNYKECRKAKRVYVAKIAWKQHIENKKNSVKKYKSINKSKNCSIALPIKICYN